MNETSIAMQSFGNLLMIEVELWSADESSYKPLYLTLDTGASVTTISSEILYQLGYAPVTEKRNTILTASGVEYVSAFRLEKIKIGDIELFEVETYAHKFPEESFTLGVVGLNVLRLFDIELLFSQNIVKLKRQAY